MHHGRSPVLQPHTRIACVSEPTSATSICQRSGAVPAASRNTPSVASESQIRKLQHSVHSETPGAESPVQPDAHSSTRSASCSACVMAVRLASRSGCTLRADAAQHRHDALGGSERERISRMNTGRSCRGIGGLSRPPNLGASSSARGTSSCRSRLLSSSAAAAKQTAGEWVFNLRRKSAQCQVRWGTATHSKAKRANVAAAVCSIGAGGGDQRSAAA